jgi:hypothetical protein
MRLSFAVSVLAVTFALAGFARADVINVTSVTASSHYGNAPPGGLINGVTDGFDGVFHKNWTTGGVDSYGGFWTTSENDVIGAWVAFDLGKLYDIRRIQIWNYNVSDWQSRSVNQLKVYASTDGHSFSSQNTLNLAKAPGTNDYPGEAFSYSTPFSAQYIKLEILSTYLSTGDPYRYTGLSHVLFWDTPGAGIPVSAVPLPGSVWGILASLGGLGLIRITRRSRAVTTA